MNFSNSLSEKLVLGYGVGGFIPASGGTFDPEYSVVGSYTLEQNWSVFLELHGVFKGGTKNSHNVDLGFADLANNSLQLDVSAGVDITTNYGDTDVF
ncbi:MAG: hypothetical protein ACJAW7_000590 [Candidatus Azotimanducaceae bacterium]|jgi:hypothetical protein